MTMLGREIGNVVFGVLGMRRGVILYYLNRIKCIKIARSAMGALAYVSDSRGKVHIPPEK